ncbi:sodium-independent sulfate anion transporter-like [Glandiceps talaboti]
MKNEIKDYFRKSCTLKSWRRKLPITLWLPKYKPGYLLNDFVAGLTVGLTVIPQGLAYATVAKLPLQYGLYSAFMGCFVYCFLGTAKDITLGPTAIMSLMVSQFGGPVDSHGYHDPMYAILLTFICGCIQLGMGLVHLGFLVNFISYPVISGFTTAAAITIGFGQVKHILGLSYHADAFIQDIEEIIKNITDTNLWDLLMAACCFLFLILLKYMKTSVTNMEEAAINEQQAIPVWKNMIWKVLWLIGTAKNAVVVITAAVVAWSLVVSNNGTLTDPFTLVGTIPAGLPSFKPPVFTDTSKNITSSNTISELNVGIIIVPLVGFLESIAIGKAFARQNNYKIDTNQELIALGSANVLGSFVSSYPVTGSFSRTAVNSQSGVKTPLGGVFTGILIILALVVLTPAFQFIPQASLAAVIIVAVSQMVDFGILKKLWKISKLDLLPWFATVVLSLVLGIEIGIICGIGIDLLAILYRAARPKIQAVTREILVIKLSHGIQYPSVDHIMSAVVEYGLEEYDNQLIEPPKAVIIDCSHVFTVDYTTVQGMTELIYEYKKADVRLVFAGLEQSVSEVFLRADISGFTSYGSVDDAISALVGEFGTQNNPKQKLLENSSENRLYGSDHST